LFTAGIIINEALLMIQGIADLSYKPVPFMSESLLGAACILFCGMLVINYGQRVLATSLRRNE
ncbi:MAG: hypothetical protein Q8941_22135, partial [Bacteroidota bacterium]|nr:hypothetical protein [Bacteroidota bacterium]